MWVFSPHHLHPSTASAFCRATKIRVCFSTNSVSCGKSKTFRSTSNRASSSSFFWLQSMIRSDEQRSILFDLDIAIQRLSGGLPDEQLVTESTTQLTGVYHNLLRQWAEM